jgi:hypothetical protein
MNPKDLIGNQMHFPLSSGRVLVRTFEPEDFPNIRAHEVEIPVPIDIMKDAVDTTRLHFCIFGFGFGNDEGLFIFGAKIHEELSLSGEQDLLLTIPSIIMSGGGINMRSGIDFLTSPIRILGKKKIGRCKK